MIYIYNEIRAPKIEIRAKDAHGGGGRVVMALCLGTFFQSAVRKSAGSIPALLNSPFWLNFFFFDDGGIREWEPGFHFAWV